MRNIAFALVMIGLMGRTGFAAVEAGSVLSDEQYFNASKYTEFQIRLAPTVGSTPMRGSDALTYGTTVGLTYRTDRRTEWGIETGYLYTNLNPVLSGLVRSGSLNGLEVSASIIPVLVTYLHRFSDGPVQPYLGMSFGVNFTTVSVSSTSGNSASASGHQFPLFVRPGIDIALNKNFAVFAELKTGVTSAGFMFLPQAGLNIGI